MWGEQMARKKLKRAGFNSIDVRQVEGDILHNYFVASKRRTSPRFDEILMTTVNRSPIT